MKKGRKNTNPNGKWENIRIDHNTKMKLRKLQNELEMPTYDQTLNVIIENYYTRRGDSY